MTVLMLLLQENNDKYTILISTATKMWYINCICLLNMINIMSYKMISDHSCELKHLFRMTLGYFVNKANTNGSTYIYT